MSIRPFAPVRIILCFAIVCTTLLSRLYALSCPDLLITELLRNPAGKESKNATTYEFVECVNTSTDTIDCSRLHCFDGDEHDSIIAWTDSSTHPGCIYASTLLAPGQFAIILCRAYADLLPSQRFSISPNTLLLTTLDGDIGNTLSKKDGFVLYSKNSESDVHIHAYAADSALRSITDNIALSTVESVDGRSIIAQHVLAETSSYTICPDSLTPGSHQSIRGPWITEWECVPPHGDRPSTIETRIMCVYAGMPVPECKYTICSLRDQTCVVQNQWKSHYRHTTISALVNPAHQPWVYRIHESDTSYTWKLNTTSLFTAPGSLRITEVMPKSHHNIPEWFEIHNTTEMPIECTAWAVATPGYVDTLTQKHVSLPANSYAVVTKDADDFLNRYPAVKHCIEPSVWHALSNNRDTIVLLDNNGGVHDSVAWDDDWFPDWDHESLIRIDSNSPALTKECWVRADRSSPGQPNALVTRHRTAKPRLRIAPLVFTPDNDGCSDKVKIETEFPGGYSVDVSIYGFSGRCYTSYTDIRTSAVYWYGKDTRNRRVPPGPYYVIARFSNPSACGHTIRKKGILWYK